MPGDQVKGKDSAIFFSSSSVAQRPQTQAKRRNAFFYTFTMEVNSAATKPHSCGRRVRIYPGRPARFTPCLTGTLTGGHTALAAE